MEDILPLYYIRFMLCVGSDLNGDKRGLQPRALPGFATYALCLMREVGVEPTTFPMYQISLAQTFEYRPYNAT